MTKRRDRLPAASHASVRAPLDEKLLEHATAKERQIYEAVQEHGSNARAARALGMSRHAVHASLARLHKRAGSKGWAPEAGLTRPAIPGFAYKRISTLARNEQGEPQWQIQEPQKQRDLDAIKQAMEDAVEEVRARGAIKPTPPPKTLDSDLMCAYPIGDAHIGLYSWAAETGDDHNLETAEADLTTAMEHLVSVSPPADQALVISVGDQNHADSSKNQTPASGHILDVDTRYAKVMSGTLRTNARLVRLALTKHRRAHVILARGNHDPHAAVMQAIALAALFADEPRVTVDTSPAAFYWYRHGKCFIGVNHGDKVKPQDIPLVMATDRPKDWAAADHRHVYGGHWHHDVLREFRGCTVETIRTLAASDNYAAEHGYRSGRDMKCDVWHKEDGRLLRHTIGIRQVRRIQKGKKAA